MIGIEFEYNAGYEKIIYNLLKNIDNCIYNVVEQEIIYKNAEIAVPNILNKETFAKYFNESENYYAIFANVQIFDNKESITKIENYDEFIKSKCKLILLISDAYSYEMYFNDERIKTIILNNLSELNIKYNIKTKENDGRTRFYLN